MMNLRRRFVNLLAENDLSSVYSLRRLDVSEHLFYPSTAEAEAAKPEVFSLASLPAPICNFQPAVVGRYVEQHLFGLANPRISECRILWRSQEWNTFLYDADSHTAWSMPSSLRYKGKRPIVISAPVPVADADAPGEAEDLFVMCSNSGYRCFQVLRFDHSKPKPFNPRTFTDADPSWEWDRLPPPPLSDCSSIYSHAVLGGRRIICVSASPFGGTYLFDTVKRQWMWQATSDWHMPFFGAPQYVPDLKLWLGVSWSGDDFDDRHHLCASSDLGAAVAAAAKGRYRPSVTVKHHWKGEGLETPVGWNTASAGLLDLGDSRFCIAKIIYEVVMDDYPEYQNTVGKMAALLTGVEIVRGAGDNPSSSSEEEGFRMVVHKSLRYIFRGESIKWVL
ncbi:uncharacterized protein C2845_PM15G15320 [Panicum miliaceum]|uniref:DUF1618 domain-containing protein n=1 Tax=Panicum miliaceum TaxID=4540 RepID=A0A3L6Q546_PANMI|nr:uncharacterized protein C2845_PM15G15320 [Panicum miliaceum]